MDLYRDFILDHYKNPRNFGHLDHPTSVETLFNSACGDKLTIEVMIETKKPAGAVITDIRFTGQGCAISQAAASLLTEEVKGKAVSAVMALPAGGMEKLLGTKLTASRVRCATLPLEALQKALVKTRGFRVR
ncbi:iron-sulfur cluster assembly scaffold protein [Patescibacteria group bacterium]|nr:iron-sulfur cluster assembly scaffold protein [Patescibacteria group bacterium]